jgi:DNA-binding transcriptional LysR family regulator
MRSQVDQLDGYLLRVLCLLLEERSVSRAARRLEQAQPAVSGALKRLREIFGDPLLVREKLEMVPTARALQLGEQARLALEAIDRLVAPLEVFDARVATKTFRVASPDYLAPSFLADLAHRLGTEAPHCRLEMHAMGPDFDAERVLAEDRLDVVIGNWPAPPERLHLSLLLEDELVCMVRSGHPLASTEVTEAAYLAASHLVPMRYSSVQRGVVETHLAALKIARDARVVVPYFAFAPYVVARTDLVFTTARHFAQAFTPMLPLVLLETPPGFPSMRFYLLWHERAHNSTAHRWLRALIAEVGRALVPIKGR